MMLLIVPCPQDIATAFRHQNEELVQAKGASTRMSAPEPSHSSDELALAQGRVAELESRLNNGC